jgi:hypothetical protein
LAYVDDGQREGKGCEIAVKHYTGYAETTISFPFQKRQLPFPPGPRPKPCTVRTGQS